MTTPAAVVEKALTEIKIKGEVVHAGDELIVKHYGKVLRITAQRFFFKLTTWVVYEHAGATHSVPRSMCRLPESRVSRTRET